MWVVDEDKIKDLERKKKKEIRKERNETIKMRSDYLGDS